MGIPAPNLSKPAWVVWITSALQQCAYRLRVGARRRAVQRWGRVHEVRLGREQRRHLPRGAHHKGDTWGRWGRRNAGGKGSEMVGKTLKD